MDIGTRTEELTPGSSVTAFVPNDGCLNFVDDNDEVRRLFPNCLELRTNQWSHDQVLISGFGRKGKAKGDIPGVRFKVVKVSGVGLLALWKEKKVRLRYFGFRYDEACC